MGLMARAVKQVARDGFREPAWPLYLLAAAGLGVGGVLAWRLKSEQKRMDEEDRRRRENMRESLRKRGRIVKPLGGN